MVYPAVFFSSFLYFYFGGKASNNKTRNGLYLIGILLLAVFSGLRCSDVGIDVKTYVEPLYQICLESESAGKLFQSIELNPATRDLEIVFVLVSFISVKAVPSLNFLLFVYALIILTCVALAIGMSLRKFVNDDFELYFALGILCFELLLYNMSLTMIRQSIACALVLLGISLALSGNKIIGVIVSLLAVTFHNTALFGLLFHLVYYLIEQGKTKFLPFSLVLLFVVTAFSRVLYFPIMNLLSLIVPVSSRYLAYEYMTVTEPDINLAWAYLVMVLVFGCADMLARHIDKTPENTFLIYMAMMPLAMYPITVVLPDAGRIMYYLFYFAPIVIPLFVSVRSMNVFPHHMQNCLSCRMGKLSHHQLLAFNISLAIVLAFIFWLGNVGLNDYSGTINYHVGITWQ